MAKKPDPKPLFSVKADFHQSLDNFVQEAMNLHTVAKQLLSLGVVKECATAELLHKRIAAFEKAMSGDTP